MGVERKPMAIRFQALMVAMAKVQLGQVLVAKLSQRLRVERVRDVIGTEPGDGLGPVERHALARREERRLPPDDQPVDPRVGLARGAQQTACMCTQYAQALTLEKRR